MNRLFITVVTIFSVFVASPAANAADLIGTVAYQLNGRSYSVEAWHYTNAYDGGSEYFLLTLPQTGPGPFPVIVFNNPYDLFPGPPSVNQADIEWATEYLRNPNYTSVDRFRRPTPDLFSCRDQVSVWNPAECPMSVLGLATEDMHRNGNVAGESKANSNVDWALSNGYAVAVTYTRHYAGRDFFTETFAVANAIEALKSMPGRIDPNRVGITGVSGGGRSSVYPFTIVGRPLNVAAAVAEAAPLDFRELVIFAFVDLPNLQPPAIYSLSWSWLATPLNNVVGSLGRNINDPVWDLVTINPLAGRFNSPVLLIAGTDDGMIPYSQSINFHAALRALGKSANKWIYLNGTPDFANRPIQQLAHGIFDANSPVKRRILTRNYFLQKMAPNVPEVVYRHPEDVDLVAMVTAFRQNVCSSPADKQNIAELLIQAANPIIRYVSVDPRVPAGTGPGAVAGAINAVWSAEGVSWNSANVISHLQAGDLPNCGQDVSSPTVPGNLSATAISSSQINLSWSASTDNVGVTGYRVYRGGALIATLSGGATSYPNIGLASATTYSYQVEAFDGAGNVSARSAAVPGTTLNPCDLNGSGVSVTDVQLSVNQAIGISVCIPAGQAGSGDIDRNGSCSVIDVQRVVNAALGGVCLSP